MTRISDVVIHSDGACSGNPGPGGWSACLEIAGASGTKKVMLRGGAPHTTNNVMELSGAANGLAYALDLNGAESARIRLRTDSEYVLKGLREWSANWKRRGWKTASGDPVKNRELWERLSDLRDRAEAAGGLLLEHVRGHSGDPGNEAADKAAVAARDQSRMRTAPWADPPEMTGPAEVSHEGPAVLDEAEAFRSEAETRGYRRYRDSFHQSKSGYLFSMQLRVRDGADTLYFVNVDAWDMGELSRGKMPRLSLEASVQFHTEDDNQGDFANVTTPFRGFEDTEAFFARMWAAMSFGRYERADPGPEA